LIYGWVLDVLSKVLLRKVALGAFWIVDREVARMQRHLKVDLTRNFTFEIILLEDEQWGINKVH
jgi:hypothetical protein